MSPPMLGSSASCSSFSSCSLRSHSITCLSASTISAIVCFFSSATWSMRCSILMASASSSLSSLDTFISSTKLSFASSCCSSVFLAMSAFKRCMSVCMCATLLSTSFTSLVTFSYWRSSRARFCTITVCSDLRRCTVSPRLLFSFTSATSSTWKPTQRRCSSLPSTPLLAISRVRLAMVASSGPVLVSSMFAVSLSYWRLSRSTSLVLLSISSLRRRISISYFSIVLPLSRSSSSSVTIVSFSLPLWACVFRMSTLILASSFCSCTTCV
mmetsp:Transcript_21916/g.41798  ORF Transcript_21916/g.41798 Transcript_21916/m.41798 type:complete len:269 (-) Transcript_21916:1327-2133(-)